MKSKKKKLKFTQIGYVSNFKNDWTLTKWKGVYEFLLYKKDGVTIEKTLSASTASGIWLKIVKLAKRRENG